MTKRKAKEKERGREDAPALPFMRKLSQALPVETLCFRSLIERQTETVFYASVV